ncbi:hypothetical protein HAZT_HAZT006227 [Hyalella azteca]|uniref:Uncharacterized protein n=1 Tax=Hyalella azteca TaxID=294128 RepID=A0A6A0H647_HYAAZ|nr:hypothetical protein HAZT_HAZT006227 [Hyalella azteca]
MFATRNAQSESPAKTDVAKDPAPLGDIEIPGLLDLSPISPITALQTRGSGAAHHTHNTRGSRTRGSSPVQSDITVNLTSPGALPTSFNTPPVTPLSTVQPSPQDSRSKIQSPDQEYRSKIQSPTDSVTPDSTTPSAAAAVLERLKDDSASPLGSKSKGQEPIKSNVAGFESAKKRIHFQSDSAGKKKRKVPSLSKLIGFKIKLAPHPSAESLGKPESSSRPAHAENALVQPNASPVELSAEIFETEKEKIDFSSKITCTERIENLPKYKDPLYMSCSAIPRRRPDKSKSLGAGALFELNRMAANGDHQLKASTLPPAFETSWAKFDEIQPTFEGHRRDVVQKGEDCDDSAKCSVERQFSWMSFQTETNEPPFNEKIEVDIDSLAGSSSSSSDNSLNVTGASLQPAEDTNPDDVNFVPEFPGTENTFDEVWLKQDPGSNVDSTEGERIYDDVEILGGFKIYASATPFGDSCDVVESAEDTLGYPDPATSCPMVKIENYSSVPSISSTPLPSISSTLLPIDRVETAPLLASDAQKIGLPDAHLSRSETGSRISETYASGDEEKTEATIKLQFGYLPLRTIQADTFTVSLENLPLPGEIREARAVQASSAVTVDWQPSDEGRIGPDADTRYSFNPLPTIGEHDTSDEEFTDGSIGSETPNSDLSPDVFEEMPFDFPAAKHSLSPVSETGETSSVCYRESETCLLVDILSEIQKDWSDQPEYSSENTRLCPTFSALPAADRLDTVFNNDPNRGNVAQVMDMEDLSFIEITPPTAVELSGVAGLYDVNTPTEVAALPEVTTTPGVNAPIRVAALPEVAVEPEVTVTPGVNAPSEVAGPPKVSATPEVAASTEVAAPPEVAEAPKDAVAPEVAITPKFTPAPEVTGTPGVNAPSEEVAPTEVAVAPEDAVAPEVAEALERVPDEIFSCKSSREKESNLERRFALLNRELRAIISIDVLREHAEF